MKKMFRVINVILMDVLLMNMAFFLSLYLFKSTEFTLATVGDYASLILMMTVMKLLVFKYFSLYSSLWEYASIEELMKVVGAVLVSNSIGIVMILMSDLHMYYGIYVVAVVFEIAMIGGNRFSYRIMRRVKHKRSITTQNSGLQKVLVVGSGSTACLIATEIKTHPNQYGSLVGFIDDDASKYGKSIAGVKVLGNRFDILSIVKRQEIQQIIVAIPTASKEDTKQILAECKRTGAKVRIIPGIMEVIDGHVSMNKIRDVEIEDLLGREPVKLDIEEISSFVTNKTVLVTGGGGSIGSELCRQIVKFNPSRLIILDIYENNAYGIQNELLRDHGDTLNLDVLIASVRDRENIFKIFETEKPQVVFHAAAHKHVPLMERSPKEAIKNNILGTLNVSEAASHYGIERFVLISTDKAVNPTNVMGATKRMCEMIVQSQAKTSKTKFVAVRFGNVLGSNGSVIPLFKQQIKEGGPVTVTHEKIIRYFMTIPEAAQLVIQAGAIANGGEIFVLDMGEPVRIYDLAEDLIRLSGFKPHEDIKIEITGLRPGEKLYEELLMEEEGLIQTKYDKIHIGAPMDIDFKMLRANIEKLDQLMADADNRVIKERLSALVPTYRIDRQDDVTEDIQKPIAL